MHLNSNVLTEKEAAQYLNLSRATLRRASVPSQLTDDSFRNPIPT